MYNGPLATAGLVRQSFPDTKPPACHVGRPLCLLASLKQPSVSYQHTSSILVSTPGLLALCQEDLDGGITDTAAPGSPAQAPSAKDMSTFIGRVD